MPDPISIEELEASMAAAVDVDGNDVRLAEATAHMTADERRISDDNIRAWAAKFQAGVRRDRESSDGI